MSDLILGIETSCDDTSVALVDQTGAVIAARTVSQFEIHAEYGGVFPDLASRAHVQGILPTVNSVLSEIDHDLARLKCIGVTRGPGLIGSLLVGVNSAAGLAAGWGKPIYGINHLRGHLRSADLEQERVVFPALVLLVSGGHTFLAFMKTRNQIQLLGSTRDDSMGETYDKVARMLRLPMPGGPEVDKAAAMGQAMYDFPRPMKNAGYEFSFSGLKSAVDRFVKLNPEARRDDIAASFVASCLEVVETKLRKAVQEFSPASLVVVGGVSASRQVREMVSSICQNTGILACLPPLKWSTDNGAMIALACWDYVREGLPHCLEAKPNLSIVDW